MKYLISGFLLLPLLTSCDSVQEEVYQPGYYHSAPRVARHPSYGHSRPIPRQEGVYHDHDAGEQSVVETPNPAPRVHSLQGARGSTHLHASESSNNVHGHNEGRLYRRNTQGYDSQVEVHEHD